MTKNPYEVIPVDTSDHSLSDAAAALEQALADAHARGPVKSVQVLPCRQNYSMPDPDSSHRDFHYSDVGFLIVIERKHLASPKS